MISFGDRFDPSKSAPIPSLEEVGERLNAPIKPGPPDLIPGLMPTRGQLVIAGETDIGKSLLALEICSALATGSPLWNELSPTQLSNKIVYVLGEHYNDVIKRLFQVTKLPITDNVWIIGPEQLGLDKWLVTSGRQNQTAIERLIKWCVGADLVVFDPLAAFVSGIDAENDNVQMRLVLDTMSTITQSVGASCLVLAHQGKPTMGKDGSEYTRSRYAIRGASAVEDAATNIFYMGHMQNGATDNAGLKILSLRKRKYKGDAPDEYRLLRDKDRLVHTLLGNRPFTEVRRIDTQAKVARLQHAFPDMPLMDIYKVIATTEGMSVTTVRRHLAGEG